VSKDDKVYIVLKRRFVRTIITLFIVFIIGVISSFQYANYVDQRSNKRWCDIVTLFNESYKTLPPSTDLGRKISAAMIVLEQDFHCE
jgi:hypothetical protein